MASYYACYLITAFVVYGCYIRIRQGNFKKRHIPMLVLGIVLSFATGMQSVRQTAVMALPLVACEIVLIIIYSVKNKKFTVSKSTVFAGATFIANIAGLAAMKFLEINQASIYGSQSLNLDFSNLPKRFAWCAWKIIECCEIQGFGKIAGIISAFTVLLIVLIGVILCFKDYFKDGVREQGAFTLMVLFIFGCLGVLAASVLVNVVLYSYYYFMIFPLFAVCVTYIIVKMKKHKEIVWSVILIFAAALIVFRFLEASKEIRMDKSKESTTYQVADYLLENNYDTVYAVFGLSRIRDGAENIVVASGDKIHLVHFGSGTFHPVLYLHEKDEYLNHFGKNSVFLLRESDLEKAREIAQKFDVEMTLKAEFDGGIYLYEASENLCALSLETQD